MKHHKRTFPMALATTTLSASVCQPSKRCCSYTGIITLRTIPPRLMNATLRQDFQP